jgi:predicted nucleic acid-binding protein
VDVLFDANTLISGIFLPYSQSRKVLDKLWSGTLKGFVCRDTLDEAQGAFERAYRNTGVDLSGAFESTLVRLSLSTLPGVPQGERSLYRRVKGSGDKALVATAKRYHLMICTNDIKDFRHAGEYRVSVVTPDRLADEGGPSLERIVLGNLASEKEGTIYMVTEPNWVGMNIDKVFEFASLIEAKTLNRQRYLWRQFSFEHVPVEIISHIYERFVQGASPRGRSSLC